MEMLLMLRMWSWTTPIGPNPPAIGVDFFEGPYQDNDGLTIL
jgi:hypothetical protein